MTASAAGSAETAADVFVFFNMGVFPFCPADG